VTLNRTLYGLLTLSLLTSAIGCDGFKAFNAVGVKDSSSSASALPLGSTMVRRLNRREYNFAVRDLLHTTATPGDALPADDRKDYFDTVDSALRFYQAHSDRLVDAAQTLADNADLTQLVTCDITTVGCVTSFIDTFSKQAFRTTAAPWEADQLTKLIDLYKLGKASVNADRGVRLIIQTVLTDARFLYKMDTPAADGKALSGDSIASRLSFFLWSSIPDATLLAKASQLTDPSVLASEVTRMLNDPKASAFVQTFVGEWLDIDKLTLIEKDPTMYPAFKSAQLRADLQTETQMMIRAFIDENRPVSELLSADFTFLNQNLATFYGISGVSGTTFRKVGIPSGLGRAGILTHGSVLAASSGPLNTSPVKRGKTVLDRVLCSAPPPPPAGAGIFAMDLSNLSKRDRFARHAAAPACASCHTIMEPIGFGLENFDITGQYRVTDERGDAVDSSGKLVDGTPFSNQMQLVRILSGKPQVVNCVLKNLATYGLNRSVTSGDIDRVGLVAKDTLAQGLGFRDMLIRLVSDQIFLK
jgi:hypothetical protein